MTARLAVGLLFCAPLPAMYGRLRRSAAWHDSAPVVRPTDVAVAVAGREGIAAATRPPEQQPVVAPTGLVVENRPSDPQPVVTPERAKAGGVRRAVQGTPCHDCSCCETYSARLAAAQVETDQLRAELIVADGRRLNHRHVDPAPFGSPATAGAS